MATIAKKTIKRQSLLVDAFEAVLEKFGPEKAARVWQVLTAPRGDYMKIRNKLLLGKNAENLDREIKKFNR